MRGMATKMHASEPQARIAWSVRAISLVAALTISVALMLFPFLLREVPGNRLHVALPVLLIGVAGSWVHGVGYGPDNRWLRVLFGPACAWAIMAIGAWLLFA